MRSARLLQIVQACGFAFGILSTFFDNAKILALLIFGYAGSIRLGEITDRHFSDHCISRAAERRHTASPVCRLHLLRAEDY